MQLWSETSMGLFLEQVLNAVQLGLTLFIVAAGLTLVFGIMGVLNLAHGSLYMIGAYLCAALTARLGSFALGVIGAVALTAMVGLLMERLVLRHLYHRDHLDQVLATFGLILFFNELVRVWWGPVALFLDVPPALAGSVALPVGASFATYRLFLIAVAAATAGTLWWIVARTKLGMLIRAVASQRGVMPALGVNTAALSALVFAIGAALAAISGALTAPLYTVQSGMGDALLIQSLVVLVIGGITSVRGAFVAALLVGAVDTIGRLLPGLTGAPASIGDVAVYLLMIVVLMVRPSGLFGRA
jgi:branched-chain amino acid transport system permease protein